MSILDKAIKPQDIQMYTISDFLMQVANKQISINGTPVDQDFLNYVKQDIAFKPDFIDSILFSNLTPVCFDITKTYSATELTQIDFKDSSLSIDPTNHIIQIIKWFTMNDFKNDLKLFLSTFYSNEVANSFDNLTEDKQQAFENRIYNHQLIFNIVD